MRSTRSSFILINLVKTHHQKAELVFDFGETSFPFSTASVYPPLCFPSSSQQAWGNDLALPEKLSHA